MAKFKVFDWLCDSCHQRTEVLVDTAEEGWDGERPCVQCSTGTSKRAPSGPPVQNVSFVDGTKRKGWEDMKKVARLEVAKAGMEPSKRGEIEKEIAARKKL